MTKNEATTLFDRSIKRYITPTDKVAIRCAWCDFVDALVKNGDITEARADRWGNPYSA